MKITIMSKKVLIITIITNIFFILSCDGPKKYLFNGGKSHLNFNCNDDNFQFTLLRSLSKSDIIKIDNGKVSNIKVNNILVNNNPCDFNIQKYDKYTYIKLINYKFFEKDKIDIEININDCSVISTIIID
jgi:hypothetical protein